MLDISKFLILVLLLNCITSLQTELNDNKKEAVEIKFGTMVNFDKNNNYFKFTYNGDNDVQIYISFGEINLDIYLTNPKEERYFLENEHDFYVGNLTYNGIYYLEIFCQEFLCELGSRFTIIYPRIDETIDLSKNIYYQKDTYSFNSPLLGMIQYKVSNLKEETYVYFENTENDEHYKREYIPYYPDEDYPYDPYNPYQDFSNLTMFEVINNTTNTSKRHVRFYKFLPGNEYIINIHYLVYYYNYHHSNEFLYSKYMFIPITKS